MASNLRGVRIGLESLLGTMAVPKSDITIDEMQRQLSAGLGVTASTIAAIAHMQRYEEQIVILRALTGLSSAAIQTILAQWPQPALEVLPILIERAKQGHPLEGDINGNP